MTETIKKAILDNGGKLPSMLVGFVVNLTGKLPPKTLEGEALLAWITENTKVPPKAEARVRVTPIPATHAPPPLGRVTVNFERLMDVSGTTSFTRTDSLAMRARVDLDDIEWDNFGESLRESLEERGEEFDRDYGDHDYGDEDIDDESTNDSVVENDRMLAAQLIANADFARWCESKGVGLPTVEHILDGTFATRLEGDEDEPDSDEGEDED